jgi:hypothetical protein
VQREGCLESKSATEAGVSVLHSLVLTAKQTGRDGDATAEFPDTVMTWQACIDAAFDHDVVPALIGSVRAQIESASTVRLAMHSLSLLVIDKYVREEVAENVKGERGCWENR